MAASKTRSESVDLTTGIGTLSFPHLFTQTASTNDKGEKTYDCQLIIPKAQRDDVRALLLAVKKVGESKWGDKWKSPSVRNPLRDGDKEKDDLTEDGSTKGEKYPERLGCYFINARSQRPVGVFDRQRVPITNPDDVYSGMKAKINVTFYAYSSNGNHGIGVALNGVQKIADGESLGGTGRPSVESMFDLLDDEDIDLDEFDELEEIEEEEEVEEVKPARRAAKKAPAKKAAARPAAKKAAARKPKVEEVEVDDEDDDLYDDLDDLDDLDED